MIERISVLGLIGRVSSHLLDQLYILVKTARTIQDWWFLPVNPDIPEAETERWKMEASLGKVS
jgi:hypothetical protein